MSQELYECRTYGTLAEMTELTAKQHAVIALLATGMSRSEAARHANVARKTIQRWDKQEEFATELEAECERRAEREKELRQRVADQVQDEIIKDYRDQMIEYHESVLQAYKQRLARGLKLIQKAGKRFDDLPEESIKPSDIPSLITTGDRLLQSSLDNWAQAIKIEQALKEMNG